MVRWKRVFLVSTGLTVGLGLLGTTGFLLTARLFYRSPALPMMPETASPSPRDAGKARPGIEAATGAPQALDIKCTYRFHNVSDKGEVDLLDRTILSFAKEGTVRGESEYVGSGQCRRYTFAVSSLSDIRALNSTLPFKSSKVGERRVTARIYEEFEPTYVTNFRTATITGSVEILVRFKVTPGASLFYSIEAEKEVPVPREQIGYNGDVTLRVRIPRSQEYVYARSVLGQVERYLRIDVESGQAEEIGRESYLRR